MSYFSDDDEFNNDNQESLSDTEVSGTETDLEIDEDIDVDENESLNNDQNENEDEDENEDDLSQMGGAEDSDLEEGEIDEEAEAKEAKDKRTKKIPAKTVYKKPEGEYDDDDEDDNDGEQYLQKFDKDINENYIVNYHPECVTQNYDEILSMIKVVRDKNGIIIDDLHKTIPFLTKYERARILGQRAKQINSGATPFIKVPENVIDGYIIAELELKEKRIPFIIRRPLPNGGSEYWSIKDLEDISF